MTLRLCLVLLLTVQTTLTHHRHHVVHRDPPPSRVASRSLPLDKLLQRNTDIVDMLLGMAVEYVKLKKLQHMPFPTLQKTMGVKVLGISYSVTLRGERGWVEDLSSLTRVGNVTATDHGQGRVSFATPLSLKKLSVGFDKYSLPIGRIVNLGGKINIKVGRNMFILKTMIAVDKGRDVCSFSVQGLNLATFEDFDSNMTGLGKFNWLLDFIIEAILKAGRHFVRTQLETQFNSTAKKFLVSVSCSLFSLI